MSITLTGAVDCKVSAIQLNSVALSNSYAGNPSTEYAKTFTSSDISKLYFANRTATATPDSLDLSNASLTDPYGASLTFSNLKVVYVKNNHATSPLTVFGGSSGAIPNTLAISAGGNVTLTSTFPIDSTHKFVKIDPGAATVSYDIFMFGN